MTLNEFIQLKPGDIVTTDFRGSRSAALFVVVVNVKNMDDPSMGVVECQIIYDADTRVRPSYLGNDVSIVVQYATYWDFVQADDTN